MCKTYITFGGCDEFRNIFVGNKQGSRTHVRTKHSWRNNKISLREMGFDEGDWIQMRLNWIILLVILRTTTNPQRMPSPDQ
jgi:hypothetical protein